MSYFQGFNTATRFGRNVIGFRQNSPLTDDQIRRYAPSVFAEDKHDSRSARYTFIPTSAVLTGLRREGFEVFSVMQSRSRVEGKENFTKHMLRLRRADQTLTHVGQELAEIALVNSHDGTSSYELIAGYLRLACMNGLMVASSVLESVKIAHKGDIVNNVIEGAFTVIDNFERADASRDGMKALTLDTDEQRLFARAALVTRFGTDEERTDPETGRVAPIPVTVDQALRPRRAEDRANDLWTTFNRLQETTVAGGVRHAQLSQTGRRGTTRAVTGISQNVALNRALWELAEGMKTLKTGGAINVAA